tara:strand:+ start:1673 stop:3436 length:1764 start_codon:yes stop_codon:yes gene_type:complete
MSIFEKNMDYLMHHRDTVLKTDKAKQYFDSIMNDLKTVEKLHPEIDNPNHEAGVEEYGPVPGRCKKGYHKNKLSKMCEKKEAKPVTKAKPVHKAKPVPKLNNSCENKLIVLAKQHEKALQKIDAQNKKLKHCTSESFKQDKDHYGPVKGRCRKGYHKNKTTKLCVKKKNVTLKKSLPPTQMVNYMTKKKSPKTKGPKTIPLAPKATKLITIKDLTPKPLQELSKDIQTALKTKQKVDITKLKSYSPEINQQLITKTASDKMDIFGNCKVLERYKEGSAKNVIKPRVWNGQKCVDFTLNVAQTVLLQNLASQNIHPVENIIAPKQIESNCWFNTLYMIFFISDKGRKFFKFFRQLMIQGKTAMGASIPPKLWKPFALLNLAIEGTLTGYNDISKFNTNTLIGEIYKDIPAKYRKSTVKYIGEAGNPVDYYYTIVKYLGTDKIMTIHDIDVYQFKKLQPVSKSTGAPYFLDKTVLPEVIILRLFHNDQIKHPDDISFQNSKGSKATYKLDSAAIIDTQRQHFCCLITYDKKEYGFDGASFKRLNPFKWKQLINKNQEWTFEGSNFNNNPATPITWNFLDGYRELFYYRV